MARIRKRGEQSYLLIVELGYDALGKRIQRTKTIHVDEDLIDRARKLNDHLNRELVKFQTEVENGEYISLDKLSFASFVEQWREKFVERQLEAKTVENYLFHAYKRILPYFGTMSLDKIRTMHIIDYLDRLEKPDQRISGARGSGTLSSSYIVYNYRVLRSIFAKAVSWKVLKENPMDGVEKPKENRTTEILQVYNEEEVRYILEALQEEDQMLRVIIMLAITTGMRRAEILGLEWKHVDTDKGIIDIRQSIPKFDHGQPLIKEPKTKGSQRKIAIPPFMISELKEFRSSRMRFINKWIADDRHFLFAHPNGMPFTPKVLSDRWRAFVKKYSGIKYIRFHDLRHTSATLLINQGVHAKNISARLGHSKIATTMDIYGHAIESADFAAAGKFESLVSELPVKKGSTNS